MASRRKTKKAEPTEVVEPVVNVAELVKMPRKDAATRRQEQLDALGGIKDKIFGDSMRVVEDYLRARDVNPKCAATPSDDPEYFKLMLELGDEEEVMKTYRIASSGWLPAQDAPGFVKAAMNMSIGIMKANATEKSGPKTLNVGKIMIDSGNVPQFTFDEKEIE